MNTGPGPGTENPWNGRGLVDERDGGEPRHDPEPPLNLFGQQ